MLSEKEIRVEELRSNHIVESEGLTARRPTWAEIDLDALASNFRIMRGMVSAETEIAAVVKANAYGHGAIECARRLAAEGSRLFCVALPEEAFELRAAGISNASIISLGGVWEGQEAACLRARVVPVVYRLDIAERMNRAARDAGVIAALHVKIDTGMGRLGVRYDRVQEFAAALAKLTSVRVDGLMTHFACADDAAGDDFTRLQTARFAEAVEVMRAHGHRLIYTDLANSAATFAHASAHGNMVRPGGVLYGLTGDVLQESSLLTTAASALRPVMSLRTRITLLKTIVAGETLGYGQTFRAARPTCVATLPIGYNDGFMRALSNRGRVIVRGRFAPVVGRVSMDLTMVDVTDVEDVCEGDVVTLIGGDGEAKITAEEFAREADTISYEITCGISNRVPRRYISRAS